MQFRGPKTVDQTVCGEVYIEIVEDHESNVRVGISDVNPKTVTDTSSNYFLIGSFCMF